MESNTTYEFRVFLPREETYAIRLNGSDVTGVYGPLEYDSVLFSVLPYFQYEEQPDEVAWVRANICDFVPCEMACDEYLVRI